MVLTYFEIGKMIIEEGQKGKERADYGKRMLLVISRKLTQDFGKGFSETNIKQMRVFYEIGKTVFRCQIELSSLRIQAISFTNI